MNFNSGLRGEKYVIWYDIPTIEQDVTAVKALDPDARWIAVDFRGGVTILELNVMRAFVE